MKNQGPLTKVEKFYIEGNTEKGAKQLAEDLNRSVQSVRHYIEDIQEPVPEQPKPTGSTAPTKKSDGRDFFGRHKGSVISTVVASERCEDIKKKHKKNKRNDIHKPFPE